MNISGLVKLIKECDDKDLPALSKQLRKLSFDIIANDILVEMGKEPASAWKSS